MIPIPPDDVVNWCRDKQICVNAETSEHSGSETNYVIKSSVVRMLLQQDYSLWKSFILVHQPPRHPTSTLSESISQAPPLVRRFVHF